MGVVYLAQDTSLDRKVALKVLPPELPPFEAPRGVFFRPWSWSPDGRLLAGHAQGMLEDGPDLEGIVFFSFDTKEYSSVTDLGWCPLWLADGRRILFESSARRQIDSVEISVLDIKTGLHHPVLSAESLGITPDRITWWPALSPDNRAIYFDRFHDEADVWILALGEQE